MDLWTSELVLEIDLTELWLQANAFKPRVCTRVDAHWRSWNVLPTFCIFLEIYTKPLLHACIGFANKIEIWLSQALKISYKNKKNIYYRKLEINYREPHTSATKALSVRTLIQENCPWYKETNLVNIRLQRIYLLDARSGLSCPSSVKDIISCGKPRGRVSPRSYCQKWNTFPYVFATWHTKTSNLLKMI